VNFVLVVKAVHVLSATIFFGAGLMSAWWKVRADLTGDARVIAWAQKEIVFADWVFTVPSGFVSPITGATLVMQYRMPWTTTWVWLSLGGYVAAMLLWLPAAWIQMELRKLTAQALADGTPLPPRVRTLNRAWLALGVPAFAVSVGIIYAMVAKPS
jgi:uncharacterized membrane protein